MNGRFRKGESGNTAGRPRKRRPNVSAFDIIFDKRLTVSQNGIERELSVDEALQLQTYLAALNGSKMAVRAVLKMIAKREAALAKVGSAAHMSTPIRQTVEYDSDSADEAMKLLGIASFEPAPGLGETFERLKLETWATQAALSRPGRRKLSARLLDDIKCMTKDADRLKWPRGSRA